MSIDPRFRCKAVRSPRGARTTEIDWFCGSRVSSGFQLAASEPVLLAKVSDTPWATTGVATLPPASRVT